MNRYHDPGGHAVRPARAEARGDGFGLKIEFLELGHFENRKMIPIRDDFKEIDSEIAHFLLGIENPQFALDRIF